MKKSTSYRETIRQHRLLLSLPVVLAVAIAAWLVLSAPKSYASSTSLWIDNSGPTSSSLGNPNPALVQPSTVEQNVLVELLSTKSFDLSIAGKSLLGPYLTGSSAGLTQAALLRGGGSLTLRVLAALGPKKVTTAVTGPQVLQINFTGPTPAVATSTLSAIVTELQSTTDRFSRAYSDSAVSYYTSEVQQANQALVLARNQLASYQNANPTASPNDPNLTALTTAVTDASTALTTAKENLDSATAAAGANANGLIVQTIDAPSTPLGPTTGKKRDLEGIAGGLLAGLLISFLGVLALTRRGSDPWEDELAAASQAAAVAGAPVAAQAPVAARAPAAAPAQAPVVARAPAAAPAQAPVVARAPAAAPAQAPVVARAPAAAPAQAPVVAPAPAAGAPVVARAPVVGPAPAAGAPVVARAPVVGPAPAAGAPVVARAPVVAPAPAAGAPVAARAPVAGEAPAVAPAPAPASVAADAPAVAPAAATPTQAPGAPQAPVAARALAQAPVAARAPAATDLSNAATSASAGAASTNGKSASTNGMSGLQRKAARKTAAAADTPAPRGIDGS